MQTVKITPKSRAASPSRPPRITLVRLLVIAVMFAFTAYFLLPLFWALVAVTKDNGQLNTTFGLWFSYPLHLGQNLQELVTRDDGIFLRWFANSFIYSLSSASLATLFAALAGYAFSKYRFRPSAMLFALVLGTIMVPSTALTLPIFLMVTKLGLAGSALAVILPQTVNPFGLYLMRVFWDQGVPREIIEAARIDGAGEGKVFWSIGLPLVRSGLVTVFLFSFVGAWNNFFLPLVVLNRPEQFTLTLGLNVWNALASSQIPPYTVIALGSLVSIAPLVLAFLLLGRYWQSNLTAGAVKS